MNRHAFTSHKWVIRWHRVEAPILASLIKYISKHIWKALYVLKIHLMKAFYSYYVWKISKLSRKCFALINALTNIGHQNLFQPNFKLCFFFNWPITCGLLNTKWFMMICIEKLCIFSDYNWCYSQNRCYYPNTNNYKVLLSTIQLMSL